MFERFASRVVALGLSGLVTLTIVTALANTADQRYDQACLTAHAQGTGTTQQVVITGQRQPRS